MTDAHRPTLLAALKKLAGTMACMARTRLELAGIELAEEKNRLLTVAFLGMLATSLIALAIMTLTALVTLLFWETYRWQSLAAMALLHTLGATACLWKIRRSLRDAPPPFAATLSELDKDREILRQ